MVSKVAVEGFKSIAERATLELGRVNVLIGPNAAGKSSLLEAVGVLGAAAGGRVDDAALLRRGVRPGVPALYKSALKGKRYPTFISLAGTWERQGSAATYEVGLSNPIERPEAAWRYRTESLRRDGTLLPGYSRSPRSRLLPVDAYTGLAARGLGSGDLRGAPEELVRALADFAIFSPATGVLRGIEPDTHQRTPIGLSGGRLAEALGETIDFCHNRKKLQHVVAFMNLLDWVQAMSVRRLGVKPAQPTRKTLSPSVPAPTLTVGFWDRYMREGRDQLVAYDASEGALYVLFLMILALHPNSPPILAIDNFDVAMHPRLARAVTRTLCEHILVARPARQILLTTHNPLVLDGLDLQKDDIRLFAVERGTSGVTQVHRITVSVELLSEAERGMTLSRLWVMGRLGAVPNV